MSSTAEMLGAYGEAVFYTHLIEDMLKLYVFDCAFYKKNCMAHVPLEKIRRMQFEDLIDMLRLADPDNDETEAFVARLHVLRRVRNILVHGFVMQIHKELPNEEGRDQITAMLRRFVTHAREMHSKISGDAFAMQRREIKRDFMSVFDHPGHPGKQTEGTVTASDLQKLISELESR
jgi:hypothetical protein